MSISNLPDSSQFFLIGILAPQSVEITVQRIKAVYEKQGFITAPLPAMLPVAYTISYPPPIPPGLLPHCTNALSIGKYLSTPPYSGWITLPVYADDWPTKLRDCFPLTENIKFSGSNFPLGTGIPIAWRPTTSLSVHHPIPSSGTDSTTFPAPGINSISENTAVIGSQTSISTESITEILSGSSGWRALVLACYEISYSLIRPWFMCLYWQEIWRRRLRRAPQNLQH